MVENFAEARSSSRCDVGRVAECSFVDDELSHRLGRVREELLDHEALTRWEPGGRVIDGIHQGPDLAIGGRFSVSTKSDDNLATVLGVSFACSPAESFQAVNERGDRP